MNLPLPSHPRLLALVLLAPLLAAAAPAPTVTVPARYGAAKTSGLTVAITGPTSELAIALRSEP